ncbi:Os09g0285100 [Oryza sativa Japonica Group]|uniref:Os09g0285100 protein n=1 Tax=Oryza sativa subsp. japonica TaxID=39947 RepID=A0A0P0XKP8_ORYSJ|nr:Os09g0285100 [Oryza sativa Japonica Group]
MPPAPMCIARVIGHPLATSAVLRLPPSKATAPCPSCSPITDASSSIGSDELELTDSPDILNWLVRNILPTLYTELCLLEWKALGRAEEANRMMELGEKMKVAAANTGSNRLGIG